MKRKRSFDIWYEDYHKFLKVMYEKVRHNGLKCTFEEFVDFVYDHSSGD
jgi:hypothetical protein